MLLVEEVRIDNGSKAVFVSVRQHAPQFTSSRSDAARNDQRSTAKVDESDFAALLDSPPTAQIGRQARLPSM